VQQAASGIDRRNLRGRCGGSRVRRRKLPVPRHTEPFRALVSVRGRRRSTKRKKRRVPLDCKAPSLREGPRDEGPTAGDQRGERRRPPRAGFPGGGKHPDCRDGTPLRGGSRNGDLGRRVMRKGLQPSEYACRPTTTGCSIRDGGGEPPDTLSRLARREGRGTFNSARIGPCSCSVTASTILGATDGGLWAPPRTRRQEER